MSNIVRTVSLRGRRLSPFASEIAGLLHHSDEIGQARSSYDLNRAGDPKSDDILKSKSLSELCALRKKLRAMLGQVQTLSAEIGAFHG